MTYSVRIEQQESRPLAVVRRQAKPAELARVVPEACGIVWGVVSACGIAGAGRHVALYQDDVIHLEVGVELTAPFGGHGEVVDSATPAGLVAVTTHLGPYSRLHEAHAAVCRWCSDHGHALAGPCWEIYGHWESDWDQDPSRITTEVAYLLASDGSRPG